MATKQEVTIEEAEGAVTVSTWARAPSTGVVLQCAAVRDYFRMKPSTIRQMFIFKVAHDHVIHCRILIQIIINYF